MDNKEILEKISDLCKPLTPEQREYLTENLTVYTFRKNEAIYSEGEFPTQLMCLLSGKVKIFKNGVSGRNQIIRVIKPVFCPSGISDCCSRIRSLNDSHDSYDYHHKVGK